MDDILLMIIEEINSVISEVDRLRLNQIALLFEEKRRIFVDGDGRSGLMAKGFAMRLMHLGFEVYVIGETITPSINSGDLLVSVSGSGKSLTGLNNVEKAIKANATVIAITSKSTTDLAIKADEFLVVPGTTKGDLNRQSKQLLSSLFDQSLHIVLDALCLIISYNINTSNEKATNRHW